MEDQILSSSKRRSFLTYLNAGAASVAAAIAVGTAGSAKAQSTTARFEPAHHEKDDWFDTVPGKHRLLFDTTTPDGFGEAIAFASNYIRTNKTDYNLASDQLAVVIVARHRSTAFAFNNAMWEKYGKPMAGRAKFEDPKTKTAPKINVYNATDYGELLNNRGQNLESLFRQGVQLAVCSVATRGLAGEIATATGGNVDAINTELISNLVPSSRMVPAGIVAAQRAQERGYSMVRS